MTGSASLSERLGHGPDERLLIVNCDDLGSSHAANLAIEAALRRGVATSATLMVPCPWALEAARLCAGLDIGVHLTLTAEYPGYRWRALTAAGSLHNDLGFMPAKAEEVWARAELDDVRAECRAQIDQALAWGVDVTHLDTHMGAMQVDPRFFEIYVALGEEYRLPLRMVGERAHERLGFAARDLAAARGLAFADHFIAPPWGVTSRGTFVERVPGLKPGVSEIFLHPVEDGPELRGYDLEAADLRAEDAAWVVDPAMRGLVEEAGVKLISFRPLRDFQRAETVAA
jgi:chitin disaccharide deacetylase